MATLTEYDGSIDDTNNFGTGLWELQSFKIPNPASITGISFKGSRGNSPSGTTYTINVRSDTYNGTIVGGETFNLSTLPAYTATPGFVDVTFTTPFNIVDETKTYFLEIKPNDGSVNDEIRWSIDTTSPSYADGNRWTSGGTDSTTIDHNFKIYGTEGGSSAFSDLTLMGIG